MPSKKDPLEKYADALLKKHGGKDYPILSDPKQKRIRRMEMGLGPLDPNRVDQNGKLADER